MSIDDDIIQADMGLLFSELHGLGYRVKNTRYDAQVFGNYQIVFVGRRAFVIVRDRGQYMVQADKDALVKAGLWCAFNSISELHPKLIKWLTV